MWIIKAKVLRSTYFDFDKAPSIATVKRCKTTNSIVDHLLADESREGRPKSAFVLENIDAVRELIKQDRHITYREIQSSLGISMRALV